MNLLNFKNFMIEIFLVMFAYEYFIVDVMLGSLISIIKISVEILISIFSVCSIKHYFLNVNLQSAYVINNMLKSGLSEPRVLLRIC